MKGFARNWRSCRPYSRLPVHSPRTAAVPQRILHVYGVFGLLEADGHSWTSIGA